MVGGFLQRIVTMATFASTSVFPRTGDEVIDVMTMGYKWLSTTSTTVINWSISNGFYGEAWPDPLFARDSFSTMLGVFSSYANIQFNYVGYYTNPEAAATSGSHINFAIDSNNVLFDSASIWGLGFFPTTRFGYFAGDIYFNGNSGAAKLSSYAPGSAGDRPPLSGPLAMLVH